MVFFYRASFQEDIGGVAIIKEREREREKFKKRETAPGKLRDQSSIAVTNERRRDEMGFPHLKEEGVWCGPCGSRTVLVFD